MANEFFIPSRGDVYRDGPAHAVWTRQRWADAWSLQPFLFANSVRWGSGPVRSDAQLEWDYGQIMQAGTAEYTEYVKKDLLGHYILLEIAQSDSVTPLRWYGIVTDDGRRRDGATPRADGTLMPAGLQTLGAEGLDLLLMRTQVNSAVAFHAIGGKKEYSRGLTFNRPNVFEDTGNRSFSTGQDGVYLFACDMYDARWWSTGTILDYLLQYHPPLDGQGNPSITFRLSADARAILPDWDRPVVATHGRSVRSIINELCASHRLLTWQLVPASSDPGAPIELDVVPYNAEPLELPGGQVQQPNRNLIELGADGLQLDRAVDAKVGQRDSDHHRVDQVIVRGARKRVVASWGYQDGTLAADHVAADKTDYETLPAEIAALTDLSKKQARMQAYRREEQRQRVFCWFRVPADWDNKVSDGTGTGSVPVAIAVKDMGPEIATIYIPELRFERTLPKELFDTAPEASPKTPPPPMLFFKTEDDLYEHADQLAAKSGIEGMSDGAGRNWACSLRMQPDAPGVIVAVHGSDTAEGGGQHLIAASDFTPIAAIGDKAGDLDWQHMILTAMIQLDASVEARYPADDQVPAGLDATRRKYIDLGDAARLDAVHRLAVVGVEDGVIQYRNGEYPASYNEYLRDDRPMMADLARFLFEWYGQSRKAFTLKLDQLSAIASVGQLITRIVATDETEAEAEAAETVNALVTGVAMDLRTGTTHITTGFADLDPIQLV